MNLSCSDKELFIIKKAAQAAKELGIKAWVVGGFVRDKLLNRPTKDIDIVCLGDGIALANNTAEKLYPKPMVNFFKTFGTAQFKYFFENTQNEDETNCIEVEFVGARKESYQMHSRKPEVSIGTLQDDQNRRDFTINAMAMSLNDGDFGELIDPFDGLKHLMEKRLITPLEPVVTFSDDPLRMIRAIRFATQ